MRKGSYGTLSHNSNKDRYMCLSQAMEWRPALTLKAASVPQILVEMLADSIYKTSRYSSVEYAQRGQ